MKDKIIEIMKNYGYIKYPNEYEIVCKKGTAEMLNQKPYIYSYDANLLGCRKYEYKYYIVDENDSIIEVPATKRIETEKGLYIYKEGKTIKETIEENGKKIKYVIEKRKRFCDFTGQEEYEKLIIIHDFENVNIV